MPIPPSMYFPNVLPEVQWSPTAVQWCKSASNWFRLIAVLDSNHWGLLAISMYKSIHKCFGSLFNVLFDGCPLLPLFTPPWQLSHASTPMHSRVTAHHLCSTLDAAWLWTGLIAQWSIYWLRGLLSLLWRVTKAERNNVCSCVFKFLVNDTLACCFFTLVTRHCLPKDASWTAYR